MSNFQERIAALSSEQKALFELQLKKKGLKAPKWQKILSRQNVHPLPLSFAQQRLWFLDQLEPANPFYNEANLIHLSGLLHIPVVEKCFNEIIQRHEILHTTFTLVNGQLVQNVNEPVSIELPVRDLRSLSQIQQEQEVRRQATEESQKPFDLSQGPLLRTILLWLAEDEFVLLLTMHHIISDGWSWGVLLQEFAVLYDTFSIGQSSPLAELPIQYADFALWQQQWFQEGGLDTQLTYWKQHLSNSPPILHMPTDRSRPAIQTFRGARQSLTLDKNITTSLKLLSQNERVTLFVTLLAAFNVLLSRYTGQYDIIIGTDVANRNYSEIEGLIGFFVNQLVLRADLSGNPTFRELLKRINTVVVNAHAHQDFPFDKLVEVLKPERNLSHAPIFQIKFVLQPPMPEVKLSELTFKYLEIDSGTSKFDLTVEILDSEQGLQAIFEYNTDLFNTTTITRLMGHFGTILQAIAINHEQHLSDLPILTSSEYQQILFNWNSTFTDYSQTVSIHQLFEAQVELTPDKVALTFEMEELSYRELNNRANQLAHYLGSLSLGPERLVVLCTDRSLEMVIGLLGILKAGDAYVPLDPAYPKERLAFILEDTHASALVTQSQLLDKLPFHGIKSICLDTDWESISQESKNTLDYHVLSNNLAYVVYTSGSTGRPKGVQISHGAVVNFLRSMQHQLGVTTNDRLLAVTTLSFDIAVLEIFLPLVTGASLILASRDVAYDGVQLSALLSSSQATVMQGTPSTWRMLKAIGWQGDKSIKILCGGEALTRELANVLIDSGSYLYNMYGPTETTIWSSISLVKKGDEAISIGRPIANTQMYILDQQLQPVPVGVLGELYIGGVGLSQGYLNRPDLTAEKFIPHPYGTELGARLYKTGDIARYLPSGDIECLGRLDNQVKIRGFRIELGEIESVLEQHPLVKEAVVVDREDSIGKHLAAYVILHQKNISATSELRNYVRNQLPEHMFPSQFVILDTFPLTPNGKVNRRALPFPKEGRPDLEVDYIPPRSKVEQIIATVWQEVLYANKIGIHDNFFDLGGHSLLMVQVHIKLREILKSNLSMVDLFKYPTIHSLAKFVVPELEQQDTDRLDKLKYTIRQGTDQNDEIAIIGIAGRFPSSRNIEEFWQSLCNGVEVVSHFSDQEILSSAMDLDPALLQNPNYVKAQAILEDIEQFDALFFNINPREAAVMDPQHRIFLECAWEALEQAGYVPDKFDGLIGVYAGASMNTYLLNNLYPNQGALESVGRYQAMISNDKDYLATRVSYKLNLKGPSLAVQTACSTSLVAVHLACKSILNGECDMALAGGVSVSLPQKAGYLYSEDGLLSPDGHCRAFDKRAQGIVTGEGVGIVVLKRLSKALADGDYIHAVIKGTAINNDGALKVGYTAPSSEGQEKVIRAALSRANVDPETISYVEAHGTGTILGDPIELDALTQAFRSYTDKRNFCAIGSVKTNIGHLDAAAGIAGLIKTVLSLKYQQLPPSLHFEQPNPHIDFANSPFYVNTTLSNWQTNDIPRRAGVSSFGIGGTNAHAILEEAPQLEPSGKSRSWHLLALSAKTASALETMTVNLIEYLKQQPNLDIADVAYTLQIGRHPFSCRRVVICHDFNDATLALKASDSNSTFTAFQTPLERSVVFLFPGQGTQYVNMGRDLYQTESIFREQVDLCTKLLTPHLGIDLLSVLYPDENQIDAATKQLHQTWLTQPALFVIEYALAKLLIAWGVHPQAMIGHSVGEYTAACIAGVFSLEDALALVAIRGRLMQQLPNGAMLSIPLSEQEVSSFLNDALSLAAINTSTQCVVSGSLDAVESLARLLDTKGVECHHLHTSHAFHSQMVEPIMEAFSEQVKKVNFHSPRIRYISNVTGTWITEAQAMDSEYWVKHMRQTVYFANGIQEVRKDEPDSALLEVGPGRTLSALVGQQVDKTYRQYVFPSMRHPRDMASDSKLLVTVLGKLWLAGVQVNWFAFYAGERRRRLPLPTYPFERQHYWVDTQRQSSLDEVDRGPLHKKSDISSWFYIPVWKQSGSFDLLASSPLLKQKECWLVFLDECGIGQLLVKKLEQEGQYVVSVTQNTQYSRLAPRTYTIDPQQADDYKTLLAELYSERIFPQRIMHLWNVTPDQEIQVERGLSEHLQIFSFFSLLYLAQALGEHNITKPLYLGIVANHLCEVTGEEGLCPEKALTMGPCRVIPLEYPNITCRCIDIVLPDIAGAKQEVLVDQIITEAMMEASDSVIAHRGKYRWMQIFESAPLHNTGGETIGLREKGVYLITGGLGGIGLTLAEYLAQTVHAKLILIGRSALPDRSEWKQWLTTHNEQDEVSLKLRKLQAIEALGAEVFTASIDVADQRQMKVLVEQARELFGAIHGVIHAAGIADGGVIQLTTPKAAAKILAPKVIGAQVLESIFQGMELDFLILCSSISSILATFGQMSYCAANAFLNSFAFHNMSISGIPTIAIDWDIWQEVGMAVNTPLSLKLQSLRQEQLKKGILPREGVEVFARLLRSRQPQFVISTVDLHILSNQYSTNYADSIRVESKQTSLSEFAHPRPLSTTSYIAPSNELERRIADIWQELLGIEQVGIYDDFLDLGGDSLLGTQVVAQLRQIFQINIPLRTLFEANTVVNQALIIEDLLIEQVENLSEEAAAHHISSDDSDH